MTPVMGKHPRIHLIFAKRIAFGIIVTTLLHHWLISQTYQHSQHDDGDFLSIPAAIMRRRKIRIFYNLFIRSAEDESRVAAMLQEPAKQKKKPSRRSKLW